MKIYQIVEDYNKGFHAGSKATQDAVEILSSIGAEIIPVFVSTHQQSILGKIKRQLRYLQDWNRVYKTVENNSILILQTPFRIRQAGRYSSLLKLKKKKNVKIISVVHDVELLRYDNPKNRAEFLETLAVADQLVIHNDSMKQWYINQGVSENRLVTLEIFDYLNNKSSSVETDYSKRVTIAGNLSKEKSPYVYQLGQITNVSFDLLGVNYSPTDKNSNVNYKGAFPPDEVPHQLTSGFGLVWDGPSIDSCTDVTGEYLRYNNPHKLSLYISSSLPVIIWSEAAEAKFVREYGVGITVSTLYELGEKLEMISESEYSQMVENAKSVKSKLQDGYFLKRAIVNAIERLEGRK
ncbi:TPA: sugar transferase [Streptococcus suis]|nr:sugar transferase [Streptococcus suis]HEM5989253.1 sugar transferase [Streptococcus suis]